MKIIFTISLFFLIILTYGQRLMHGVGLTILSPVTFFDGAEALGITYSPRFNFIQTEKYSFSIGLPFTFGVSQVSIYASDPGKNSTIVMTNIPVFLNFNFGNGSSKANANKVGFFIGIGYSYYHGALYDSTFYLPGSGGMGLLSSNAREEHITIVSETYGPAINAGIRFGKKYRKLEFKLSLLKGNNKYKPAILGFSGIYNFQ